MQSLIVRDVYNSVPRNVKLKRPATYEFAKRLSGPGPQKVPIRSIALGEMRLVARIGTEVFPEADD